MRTTVTIDDDLLRQAREVALRTQRTLGDVVNDALRGLLNRSEAPRSAVSLPTYGTGGLLPGVDLEDKEAMAALLEGERDRRAAG